MRKEFDEVRAENLRLAEEGAKLAVLEALMGGHGVWELLKPDRHGVSAAMRLGGAG